MSVAEKMSLKLAMPNSQGPHLRGMVTGCPAVHAAMRVELGMSLHRSLGGLKLPTHRALAVTSGSVQELKEPAQF
jgi:hypothetical protein